MVPFVATLRARRSERARALASPRACLRKWACPGGVRGVVRHGAPVRRGILLRLGARYAKDLAHEPVPGRLEGLGGVGEGEGPPRIESAQGGFDRSGALTGFWVERSPHDRGTSRLRLRRFSGVEVGGWSSMGGRVHASKLRTTFSRKG